MKNKSSLTFIIVLVVLSGCLSRPSVNESPTKSVPSSAIAPPTVTSTAIFISTPSLTEAHKSTPTKAETDIVHNNPNIYPTQALLPISELLVQNENCSGSCIWGIVPGRTTLDDAQSIFAFLGDPLQKTNHEDDLDFYYSSFGKTDDLKKGLSCHIVLAVKDNVVSSLQVIIVTTDNSNDTPVPRELWVAYSPESVLKRYGLPSSVEFSVSQGPSVNGHSDLNWTMYFYYESLDLIFQYELNVKDELGVGKLVHICPQTVPMESVDIWLGKEPRNPPDIRSHKPLEQLTQMSLTDFFDVVINGGCFDLIKDNL